MAPRDCMAHTNRPINSILMYPHDNSVDRGGDVGGGGGRSLLTVGVHMEMT